MKNALLSLLPACLLPLQVVAETVYIDFDTFPGTDCAAETTDDVPTLANQHFATEYRPLGVIFSLLDGAMPMIRRSSSGGIVAPTNDFALRDPGLQDLVMDFTTPVSRVKLTTLDTDEPVTLRAFNAQGIEIATDYQPPTGDVAVEIVEVTVDGTQGFISKAIVDLRQSDTVCCAAGPEYYDLLEFDPIPVASECKLYAVHDEGLNDSVLLSIDPDDSFRTCPLSNTPYLAYDLEALDIHPQTGVIYAAAGKHSSHAGVLYQVNAQTGALTRIGATGFREIDGLSFAGDGRLWGWAQGKGLIVIDVDTAQATLIAEYAGEIEDVAWNANGTILYGIENQVDGSPDQGMRLLSYNVATNSVAVLCETNQWVKEIEALDSLADGSLIFGFHNDQQLQLGAIDPSTCQITASQIINTGFDDIEGIAWQACP